jgi:hypothetical protein
MVKNNERSMAQQRNKQACARLAKDWFTPQGTLAQWGGRKREEERNKQGVHAHLRTDPGRPLDVPGFAPAVVAEPAFVEADGDATADDADEGLLSFVGVPTGVRFADADEIEPRCDALRRLARLLLAPESVLAADDADDAAEAGSSITRLLLLPDGAPNAAVPVLAVLKLPLFCSSSLR